MAKEMNFSKFSGETLTTTFNFSTDTNGYKIAYTFKKNKALDDSANPTPEGVVKGEATSGGGTGITVTLQEAVTKTMSGPYYYEYKLKTTGADPEEYVLLFGVADFAQSLTKRSL